MGRMDFVNGVTVPWSSATLSLLGLRGTQLRRLMIGRGSAAIALVVGLTFVVTCGSALAQTADELEKLYGREVMEQALGTKQRYDLYGIHFEFDKATIQPQAMSLLDDIATTMKNLPAWRLRIVGHTNSTGDPTYNETLSRERAEAIKAELVNRGIEAGRLETGGAGPSQPVATNDTPEGQALNRRVELVRLAAVKVKLEPVRHRRQHALGHGSAEGRRPEVRDRAVGTGAHHRRPRESAGRAVPRHPQPCCRSLGGLRRAGSARPRVPPGLRDQRQVLRRLQHATPTTRQTSPGNSGGRSYQCRRGCTRSPTDDPNKARTRTSETIISSIDWPQFNHNGHWIGFGPDGKLYIATGDGGYANDWGIGHNVTEGNGQDLTSPHGKILRINTDGTVPEDNPFATNPDADPQDLGLRPPQPVALLLRHGRRERVVLRRRAAEQLRGGRHRRQGPEQRLAQDGGVQVLQLRGAEQPPGQL